MLRQELKLFGRWDFSDVKVKDEGLAAYISLEPVYLPHTCGRLRGKQFSKARMNIVERLINKLMRSGQGSKKVAGRFIRGRGNTGAKMNAMKIVKRAFEIVEERTGRNPIQVLVDAIENAGPMEETTIIIYGGIRYHQAIDTSPLRRIDLALQNIVKGVFLASFNSKKSVEECLAEELILASKGEKSFTTQRKEEIERIAESSR